MKGIQKKKDEYIYPASPTLINSLDIDPYLKQAYHKLRNDLLIEKTKEIIHDERLRPYQNQDVNFLIHLSQGKGVFNQQRTGKTPTTLVTMRLLNQNKCIIFVPKSAVYKWLQEFKTWHGGPVYTTAPSWNKKRREKAYKEFKGTLITNYDKAYIDYDILFEVFKNGDAIVVDEAQILRTFTNNRSKNTDKSTYSIVETSTDKLIKTYKTYQEAQQAVQPHQYIEENKKYNSSKLSIAIIRLRNLFKDAYALSGTPTGNRTYEIFGILTFLFPTLFKAYYPAIEYYFNIQLQSFNNRNIAIKKIGTFKSKEKEQELLEFIETFSIQRKRKDIMKWLPESDVEEIFLEPTPNQTKWMHDLKHYFETTNIQCENALTVMTALRQLAITPERYNLKELGPKFEWILDLIKEYPERPLIIVSAFTEILKILQKYLPKNKKIALLEGSTPPLKRYQIEQEFQKGEIDLILGNIQVTNVNFTLSRAEQLIFLDSSLIYIENEQVSDRILPTTLKEAEEKEGQLVTHLYLNNSIDIYLRNALLEKQEETAIINNYTKLLKKEK